MGFSAQAEGLASGQSSLNVAGNLSSEWVKEGFLLELQAETGRVQLAPSGDRSEQVLVPSQKNPETGSGATWSNSEVWTFAHSQLDLILHPLWSIEDE